MIGGYPSGPKKAEDLRPPKPGPAPGARPLAADIAGDWEIGSDAWPWCVGII